MVYVYDIITLGDQGFTEPRNLFVGKEKLVVRLLILSATICSIDTSTTMASRSASKRTGLLLGTIHASRLLYANSSGNKDVFNLRRIISYICSRLAGRFIKIYDSKQCLACFVLQSSCSANFKLEAFFDCHFKNDWFHSMVWQLMKEHYRSNIASPRPRGLVRCSESLPRSHRGLRGREVRALNLFPLFVQTLCVYAYL